MVNGIKRYFNANILKFMDTRGNHKSSWKCFMKKKCMDFNNFGSKISLSLFLKMERVIEQRQGERKRENALIY